MLILCCGFSLFQEQNVHIIQRSLDSFTKTMADTQMLNSSFEKRFFLNLLQKWLFWYQTDELSHCLLTDLWLSSLVGNVSIQKLFQCRRMEPTVLFETLCRQVGLYSAINVCFLVVFLSLNISSLTCEINNIISSFLYNVVLFLHLLDLC